VPWLPCVSPSRSSNHAGREPDIPESMCWTLGITCAIFAVSEAVAVIRSRRH
jgi:hypothetical protein